MTTAFDWAGRTGDVWAAEWRRTDRSFADLSRHLDATILAGAPAGHCRALDIGCGAGGTSLALAAARPDADVVGVDLSPELIAVARERGREHPNCRFEQGDAVAAAGEVRPDLLFSRHGVMFFDDPVAAFTRLREAAAPGAMLIFSCFGPRGANRFATLADELIGGTPSSEDDNVPGPFAFASQERVWSILGSAGWQPQAAARVEFEYRAGAGADPVADATDFLSHIGPAARAMADAAEAERARIRSGLAEQLEKHRSGDVIDLPATAWIWRARAGESE